MSVETSEMTQAAASGFQISTSGQYEFGGLLFGRGTPYIVTKVTGLFGYDGHSEDLKMQAQPGSISGYATYASKTIQFEIAIDSAWGAENIEACIDQVSGAFQLPPPEANLWAGDYAVHGGKPTSIYTQLAWRRLGYFSNRMIYCRCMRRDLPSDYDLAMGLGRLTLQFVATDPLTYGMFPMITTVTGGDTAELANNGNHVGGYAPLIVVQGSFVNPIFDLGGKSLALEASFPTEGVGGSPSIEPYLEISFKTRQTNPIDIARFITVADWWRVKPGSELFTFTGGPEATLQVVTRDTWL